MQWPQIIGQAIGHVPNNTVHRLRGTGSRSVPLEDVCAIVGLVDKDRLRRLVAGQSIAKKGDEHCAWLLVGSALVAGVTVGVEQLQVVVEQRRVVRGVAKDEFARWDPKGEGEGRSRLIGDWRLETGETGDWRQIPNHETHTEQARYPKAGMAANTNHTPSHNLLR